MSFEFRVRTIGPEETQAVAAALADHVADGDLLVLTGDLGAGKTCFTQGLGAGLGIDARITSPTFTLANRYEGRLELNHLDVYRIEQITDATDLDLPELLETGVTVIEWGEQLDPVLPNDRLTIRLLLDDEDDDARSIEFVSTGPAWGDRWEALVAAIAVSAARC